MAIRIGIDTGGTFTDVVIQTNATDPVVILKVHSTPEDPSRAVLEGLRLGLKQLPAQWDDIELLVHGTTVATNALLQRRGAKVH